MADRTLSAAIYIADIADTRGRPLTAIGALTGHNRTDEHHKAGTRFFSSPSPFPPSPYIGLIRPSGHGVDLNARIPA
jgi:hypothetical protein